MRRGPDSPAATVPPTVACAPNMAGPPLWGLSIAGADGVQMVMEHLHDELTRAMRLCGASKLSDLTPDLVAK